MDKLYIVYGTTYDYSYAGDIDFQPMKAFASRKDAEAFAIKTARESFDKNQTEQTNRECEYDMDGNLRSIHREDFYMTNVNIEEVDIVGDVETRAYIVFGTTDKYDDPDLRPMPLAFDDTAEASLYMLRNAYESIIKNNINDHSIVYDTMDGHGQGYVNIIYDGDEWSFELRIVYMEIH